MGYQSKNDNRSQIFSKMNSRIGTRYLILQKKTYLFIVVKISFKSQIIKDWTLFYSWNFFSIFLFWSKFTGFYLCRIMANTLQITRSNTIIYTFILLFVVTYHNTFNLLFLFIPKILNSTMCRDFIIKYGTLRNIKLWGFIISFTIFLSIKPLP